MLKPSGWGLLAWALMDGSTTGRLRWMEPGLGGAGERPRGDLGLCGDRLGGKGEGQERRAGCSVLSPCHCHTS